MSANKSDNQRPLSPLQRKFLKVGLKGLEDQEIIPLVFSLALPCSQCNAQLLPPACQRCRKQRTKGLEKLKSLSLRQLMSSSQQELQQMGMSDFCLFCIRLLRELPEEVLKEKIIDKPAYESAKEIFDYLYYSMRDLKKEVFKVIYLNSQNQIIETKDLFTGAVNGAAVHPREIIESAIKYNAVSVIFVHNHPSGDPTPSHNDNQLTRDLVFIGEVVQIKVLDHIIIGENRYFSFAEEGLIEKYRDDFLNIRIKLRRSNYSQPKLASALTLR